MLISRCNKPVKSPETPGDKVYRLESVVSAALNLLRIGKGARISRIRAVWACRPPGKTIDARPCALSERDGLKADKDRNAFRQQELRLLVTSHLRSRGISNVSEYF